MNVKQIFKKRKPYSLLHSYCETKENRGYGRQQ